MLRLSKIDSGSVVGDNGKSALGSRDGQKDGMFVAAGDVRYNTFHNSKVSNLSSDNQSQVIKVFARK
ncbi:hypothetical protein HanRHA438_Chr02g0088491 [Helianthus annuus]|nr:hypothetical protein HanLR1_Chr02g0067191 [Helianthus annuus]KAJ0940887.1 hypothetical protein HanRHA438_Chr02g0088491 [Helianthus annuus]